MVLANQPRGLGRLYSMDPVDRHVKPAPSYDPPWWRAVLIGSLLVPPATYIGIYLYLVVQSFWWGGTSLQLGSIAIVFFLTLIVLGLRMIARRLGLTRSELLVIYVMVSVMICVSGISGTPFMLNFMAAGQYFATPENQWAELLPQVPELYRPQSWPTIMGYYEAAVPLLRWDVISDWLLPVGYWSTMLLLLVFGGLFLTNLVGRQWVQRERLTFPLVQIPLELTQTEDLSHFWKDKLTWVGFSIPAVLQSANAINFMYPAFPGVWLRAKNYASAFTKAPWTYISTLHIGFYPWVIGMAFLLTTDMSFSCWFFWAANRVEWVVAGMMGLVEAGPGAGIARLPMTGVQGSGGMLALVLLSLWIARRQISAELAKVWDPQEDPVSIYSPRFSLWGLGLSVVGLAWLANIGGMPVTVSLPLVLLFYLFTLSLGRIVAEAGAGHTFDPNMGPRQLIMAVTGLRNLSTPTKVALAYNVWWQYDYRDNYMPHLLGAFKIREEGGVSGRQLRWALPLSVVLTIVTSVCSLLFLYYKYGAASSIIRQWYTGSGRVPMNLLSGWLRATPQVTDWMGLAPQKTDWLSLGAFAFGAVFTVGLSLARQRIYGWPFHPIGFVLAFSGAYWTRAMDKMWMPFFIAWLIKSAILRYFGIKTYQKARRFFIGVILGDFMTGTLWGLYGAVTSQQMPMFFR